jgi:general secretion pathway protein A
LNTAAPREQAATPPLYEEFYGFVQSPFTLTPDPRFLYRSESHDEAITLLLQAIRRKEGFIVLSGDIGTGKTTICRALMQQLDATTFTSLILNPFLSVEELLREVLLDFGVVSREAVRSGRLETASRHALVSTFHEFLLSLVAIKGSAVVIIDEAQHLSPQVLEQIRILSNLETNEAKLLQIVLVGQLNLLDILRDADLRQLDQRVSIRALLKPLTRNEVDAYIAHRLWVAQGRQPAHFQPAAVDLVHELTGGVPRMINLLCDRALTAGAAAQAQVITPELIREAADRLSLAAPIEPAPAPAQTWAGPIARRVGVAALALAAVVLLAPALLPGPGALPQLPPRPLLARETPAHARPIPSSDFLLPPLAGIRQDR